jgi:predicted nucleotidyltransferase component of viral defense system
MNFLTDYTKKIYTELSHLKFLSQFTFVGGSAIASYLLHRLSEDLDFFTWTDTLPDTSVFLREMSELHSIEIANSSPQQLDLFVDKCKISLFANNWEVLKNERHVLSKNIFVAEPEVLCAMKVNTLSLRAKFRDYYDLYVLNKEKYSIQEIFSFAERYLPGLTKKIFGMQITFIKDIEDESISHLQPKYSVGILDIQKHFESEISKGL